MAALPGVELKPDCGYFYNDAAGSPPGLDALSQGLFFVLSGFLSGELPPTYMEADLETIGGVRTGDGIPDMYQLGLLAAVLCKGDSLVLGQYNANVALMDDLITELGGLVTTASTLAPQMVTVGGNIVTWANGLPDAPPEIAGLKAQALTLGNGLSAAGTEIGGFMTSYGSLLTSILPIYKTWFAAMGGLNSEMQATLTGLVGDLLSSLTDYVAELSAAADGLQALVAAQPALPAPLQMSTDLQTSCSGLAVSLDSAAVLISGLALPDFSIYGVTKSASEPFSALGDYDGDGQTNKATYDLVMAQTDHSVPAFVYAVSGISPFWPGNPALPVTGGLGLLLLSGVAALTGARVLRKK